MVIQHNMEALNANRVLGGVTGVQAKSAEKLSSGYKINRAADDAAGLTISEGMRCMVRGLNRASKNAQDGISLLQTADGALEEMHSICQRIRELSVQAANDTNEDIDREAIQAEVDELQKEINRIADTTEFNKIKLLDGTMEGDFNQSMGINAAQSVVVSEGMQDVNRGIVSDPIRESSATNICNSTQLSGLEGVLTNIVPQATTAITSKLSSTFGGASISSSIGVRLYADSSTTLASVSCKYSYDSSGRVSGIELGLSVNVKGMQFDASNNLTAASRDKLETTIVHEMMHALMDDVLTNGMIGASGGIKDKGNTFPGWFKEGMAQVVAGGCANNNDWINGGLGLNASTSESQISSVVKDSANKLSSGTTASKYGTGYLACMYLGYLANGAGAVSASAIGSGVDTLLSKIKGGKTLSDAIDEVTGGKYTSINDFQNKFGDDDSARFISQLVNAAGTTGNGSIITTNLSDNSLLAGVTAGSMYTPNHGSEFVLSTASHSFSDGGSGRYSGSSGGGAGGAGGSPFHLQVGWQSGQGMTISIEDCHAVTLGMDGISMMSYDDASAAIETLDYVINEISSRRSSIGAYMNRLEHLVANLDNTAENGQAAESRIRDTDMAEEMVTYSTSNILAQAGQAMLAQASQSKQFILGLLQ